MGVSAAEIDALLPQTQCTRCGYDGCLPYAQALAQDSAALNRCAPGGTALIDRLARLLQKPVLPPAADRGFDTAPAIAWIDAEACIGCARCLPACPVDAIIGASRHLHTVLTDWCNGCERCLPACPVDCIHMQPAARVEPSPADNHRRYQAHSERLRMQAEQRAHLLDERKRTAPAPAARG